MDSFPTHERINFCQYCNSRAARPNGETQSRDRNRSSWSGARVTSAKLCSGASTGEPKHQTAGTSSLLLCVSQHRSHTGLASLLLYLITQSAATFLETGGPTRSLCDLTVACKVTNRRDITENGKLQPFLAWAKTNQTTSPTRYTSHEHAWTATVTSESPTPAPTPG